MSVYKIAIVGGGPAGCTLARILQQSPFSFDITIFEGEASVNARPQGGTLDLHTGTGLAALERADLLDDFYKYARFEGESMQFTDKNLRRYMNMPAPKSGKSRGRPEIDRSLLRQILVDSLPADMIKWNHRLRKIDQDLTLYFDHATYSGFDLLIGADGAWSKVRPLVSEQIPFYSGIGGIRSAIKDAATSQPDIHKLVRHGMLMSLGDHKTFGMQQLGDGSIGVHTWGQKPESWAKNLPFPESDSEALRAHALREYHDWSPHLTDGLRAADTPVYPHDLYMLPIGHSWTHRPGVTLMGDAAHLMTPFAGEGVNLAMTDSMHLADAIIAAAKSLSATATPDKQEQLAKEAMLSREIEKFEKDMFSRATKIQQITYDSMKFMFFVPNAPDSVIEQFVYLHVKEHLGLFAPVLAPLVWGYFALFRLLSWGYFDPKSQSA